jgi:hypothetical protein
MTIKEVKAMFKDFLNLLFGPSIKTEKDKKEAEEATRKISLFMIIFFAVIFFLFYLDFSGFF